METLRRGINWLVHHQDPAGWWKGELETNVTMDAEDVMLRRWFGLEDPERLAGSARWIRSQQGPDGAWPTFYGGPGDLSTTDRKSVV